MIRSKWFQIIACLFVLLSVCFVLRANAEADENNKDEILEPVSYQSVSEFEETEAEYQARMKWWQDARYGLFVHWGPVSLTGKEIGWNRGGHRRDGYGSGSIPPEIYDNLYRHFLPSEFDAKEWVQIIKDAGMKHIVFVTKQP